MMDAGVRAAFFASAQAAPSDGRQAPRLDREYQLLGRAKIRGQFDLRNRKGGHGQDVLGHGPRTPPERRGRGVAVSGLGADRVRDGGRRGGWLDISNSESPEFIGRVIAALNDDPRLMERSGQVVVAAQLAQELNVRDIDGRQPVPLTLASV